MKAADVMTSKVITVGPDAQLEDVARTLLSNRISGMPVLDADGKLIGIVSEGDLMRHVESGTERHRSWWLTLLMGRDALAAEYVKEHARKVSDVMTRDVIAVKPDTPLGDIATVLERNGIKRVPVVQDGKVVGIVSRANLLQALASYRAPIEGRTPGDAAIRESVMARIEQRTLEPARADQRDRTGRQRRALGYRGNASREEGRSRRRRGHARGARRQRQPDRQADRIGDLGRGRRTSRGRWPGAAEAECIYVFRSDARRRGCDGGKCRNNFRKVAKCPS